LVAWGVSLAFRADPDRLFERAFGMRPPEGVKDLLAERHYAGGPGDQTILFQFTADRPTIDRLVAHRGFKPDMDRIETYWGEKQNTSRLWDDLFIRMLVLPGPKWKNPPHISEPILYKWQRGPHEVEAAIMLWDAKSKKAYVMWLLG